MYAKKNIMPLLHQVDALLTEAKNLEKENTQLLNTIHPHNLDSARNLLHYLSIRSQDLRHLQTALSELAISSISHSELNVLDSLIKVKYLLLLLAGSATNSIDTSTINLKDSTRILKKNSAALFGKTSFDGQSKIMVTLPTEAGEDYDLVHNLVKAGMHIARINTAHDTKVIWKQMVHHIEKAAKATGKTIKVYMDMEGPKIRTGAFTAAKKQGNNNQANSFVLLYKGSKLTLTKSQTAAHMGEHPTVPLTSPEVFGHVKNKERVWFDDGKMGGFVVSANENTIVVEITQAPEDGFKLRPEKGVNFPDSTIDVSALTNDDLEHLKFIAKHADMVGFSFVQKTEDVLMLQKQLKHLKRNDLAIILKIETRLAFENFPALLLTAMQSKHCGVMIARGDLAVAIGYNRIAEVQEEILWLSEAAHIPVVWATQVLETQVKKGIATRAEISDVVKSVRAECVMLNKGPFVIDAIKTIKDIDKRMAAHEDKKRKISRSLQVAKAFVK